MIKRNIKKKTLLELKNFSCSILAPRCLKQALS